MAVEEGRRRREAGGGESGARQHLPLLQTNINKSAPSVDPANIVRRLCSQDGPHVSVSLGILGGHSDTAASTLCGNRPHQVDSLVKRRRRNGQAIRRSQSLAPHVQHLRQANSASAYGLIAAQVGYRTVTQKPVDYQSLARRQCRQRAPRRNSDHRDFTKSSSQTFW